MAITYTWPMSCLLPLIHNYDSVKPIYMSILWCIIPYRRNDECFALICNTQTLIQHLYIIGDNMVIVYSFLLPIPNGCLSWDQIISQLILETVTTQCQHLLDGLCTHTNIIHTLTYIFITWCQCIFTSNSSHWLNNSKTQSTSPFILCNCAFNIGYHAL